MTILVVGAAGQLGQAVVARLKDEHVVTAATRRDVDLTDHRALRTFVSDLRPEVVINCAAFNNVDLAEEEQELALDVNAFAVHTLAGVTADLGAILVHFSTDFVFAGTATDAYSEADSPEPQSVYAQSKLLGEWFAADNPRHYVLRVESLFGGQGKGSSVDRIIDAVQSNQPAPVFFDRVVSPSYVDDVADAVEYLVRTGAAFGLYHCVNSGWATWLDVGREIARLLDRDEAALTPVSVRDVKLRASRPVFAALSNARLAQAGHAMPPWQDALRRHLARRTAA